MAKETFAYPETHRLLELLDEVAHRSAISRGQAFEDFLHMTVCSLSGGEMEDAYLQTVKKHTAGERGKRGCDVIARMFGELVAQSETTRDDMKDLLGDLFQGAITYGERGQFLSPMPICRLMAQINVADLPAEETTPKRSVCDPCCGSGRMLLAVAELHRNWEFTGQDIDLRCVRITAINLALRNLYGYVIHGNSLTNQHWLVYRTGFNLRGFIRELPLAACPVPVQRAVRQSEVAAAPAVEAATGPATGDQSTEPKKQLFLF